MSDYTQRDKKSKTLKWVYTITSITLFICFLMFVLVPESQQINANGNALNGLSAAISCLLTMSIYCV
jgi:hypothetical protein